MNQRKSLALVFRIFLVICSVLPFNVNSATQVQADAFCSGARELGTALENYALPFATHKHITNGPGQLIETPTHIGLSGQAIDYADGTAFEVRVARGGVVLDVTDAGAFGLLVRVEHIDGRISFYVVVPSGP